MFFNLNIRFCLGGNQKIKLKLKLSGANNYNPSTMLFLSLIVYLSKKRKESCRRIYVEKCDTVLFLFCFVLFWHFKCSVYAISNRLNAVIISANSTIRLGHW